MAELNEETQILLDKSKDASKDFIILSIEEYEKLSADVSALELKVSAMIDELEQKYPTAHIQITTRTCVERHPKDYPNSARVQYNVIAAPTGANKQYWWEV